MTGSRLGERPTLETGEPVLARWFVILLLVLVPAGLGVSVWAFTAASREPLPAAERRPVGTADVTHPRGDATLNRIREVEPGPSCAEGIRLVGDEGARATLRRSLGAVCQLVDSGRFPLAAAGMERWVAEGGVARMAVFERTGLDSSLRVEDGRPVLELNAKFQFGDATAAAPTIVHELVHLAGSWPGEAVGAAAELEAVQAQARACDRLAFRAEPPRSCLDAEELLGLDDPLGALEQAGYRAGGSGGP